MTKAAVGGVLAAVACVGLGIFYVQSQKRVPGREPAGDPSTTATAPDLRALTSRLAALERSQLRLASRPVTPAEHDSGPPTPAVPTDEQAPDMLPGLDVELISRKRIHLDNTLETEGRDPEWAPHVESVVSSTLASDQFEGTTLIAAKCGATVCRIEIEHADQELQRGFHELFARTDAGREGAGAWSSELEVNGRSRTLYYVARKGYPELLNRPPPSP